MYTSVFTKHAHHMHISSPVHPQSLAAITTTAASGYQQQHLKHRGHRGGASAVRVGLCSLLVLRLFFLLPGPAPAAPAAESEPPAA
mmetsp:Transcript_36189/g.91406  ORF Transcript_36189/g.91406 Transcript_36189/m.91406 type:complete len:86 (+) Transcript_36189:137-394(+)